MKRLILSFAALIAGNVLAVEIGANAPAFEPTTTSKANVTYVDFWASWCGPCKQSFPWMNAMHEKYKAQGLRVVAINVDKRAADAEKFLKTTPAQFDVVYDADGKIAAAFNVKAMPSSYLIDAKGKVIAMHRGFRPSEQDALENELKAALAR